MTKVQARVVAKGQPDEIADEGEANQVLHGAKRSACEYHYHLMLRNERSARPDAS